MMCLDLCGVDYLAHPGRTLPDGVEPERFEVVVTLISHREATRVRLRVQVPESDPVVPVAVRACTPAPTPWSARPSTCSASPSTATPTSPAS